MVTKSTYPPLSSAAVVHPHWYVPSEGYRQRFMPPARDLRKDSVHDTRHAGHAGIPSMPAVNFPMRGMSSGQHHAEAYNPNKAIMLNSPKPRKQISNVFIACNQCRSRKVRCNSKRPTCNNCATRSDVCVYAVVKRRGPDKVPRSRRRRHETRSPNDPVQKHSRTVPSGKQTDQRTTTVMNMKTDNTRQLGQISSPGSSLHSVGLPTDPGPLYESDPLFIVTPFGRKMQWNGIVANYGWDQIADAFTYLTTTGNAAQWFYFLNIDKFIKSLSDVDKRILIQPAFIHAGLALATLMKSSEEGRGAAGREEALRLFDLAQSELSNSCRFGWIDVKLAAAALIMALFELSLRPLYNPDRLVRALHNLDDIVHTHKMTQIDAPDPLATKFPTGSVPTIPETISYGQEIEKMCLCLPHRVRGNIPVSQVYPLPWNAIWTDEETEAEECRRVCWNALAVVANYNALCVYLGREPVNFWLTDPGNYALSFPGEVIDRVSCSFGAESTPSLLSPKESVWALYCRSMLLFNFCTRLMWGNLGAKDKSEIATEIANEAVSLQNSLNAHSCNFNTPIMLRCQVLIQNSCFIVKRKGCDHSSTSAPIFDRGFL